MSMTNTGPASAPPPLPTQPVSLRRQLIFWACALLVFIALLWLLNDVLLPFVAGMVLAYLLDPLVKQLQKFGFNRAWSAVFIVIAFAIILIVAIILVVPILASIVFLLLNRRNDTLENAGNIVKDQLARTCPQC